MATKQADYPYGLIAGGMGDGTVNVWDPAKLVASHPQSKVSGCAEGLRPGEAALSKRWRVPLYSGSRVLSNRNIMDV